LNLKSDQPSAEELVLLPLGGMGEIGMNCYAYGYGPPANRRWILVDLGVKFGEEQEPGVDVVLPDLMFIEAERSRLLAIVLTHAHEDHLGALPWLWERLRAPVYCTAFAAEVLKLKFAETALLDLVPLKVLPLRSRFSVGPFSLEYIDVTHSIPESNALVIRTRLGTVLHSGDWKIDKAPSISPSLDEMRLREIGSEGVRALVCDSTNALRAGSSLSESDVADVLQRIVGEAKTRIAVTTFGSHVGRVASAARAARLAGREVVVAGRAMRNMIACARAIGLLAEEGDFLDEEAFGYLPPERVLLLCTGSQGEPRAALARIAEETHPTIALDPGDTVVFSSKTIPGNEKAVGAVINNLAAQGIIVITADQANVHTSGHPRQEELRRFYRWLNPQLLVPMHGEAWHLHSHAGFARSCGIAESAVIGNGEVLRLAPAPSEVISEMPAGRLHVDGRLIVPAIDGPARMRRKLSFVGIVFVSLVLDRRSDVASNPIVDTDGLPAADEEGTPFADFLRDVVERTLDALPRAQRHDDSLVIEAIRHGVRRAADTVWGKKPVCHVVVHRM
jgi:ribonuclease J